MMEHITTWLNSEERGVSPVIGVILMVAITVIMAAVIGTFVLGLGDQIGDTQPTTNIDISANGEDIELEHTGGDAVSWDDIRVVVDPDDDEVDVVDDLAFPDNGEFSIGDIESSNGALENTDGDEEGTATISIVHDPTNSYLAQEEITLDVDTS